MNYRQILIIPVLFLIGFLILVGSANAAITFSNVFDCGSNGFETGIITQGPTICNIDLPPGSEGGTDVTICSLAENSNSMFNEPLPPDWELQFTGPCVSHDCSTSVWTKPSNTSNVVSYEFTWTLDATASCAFYQLNGVDNESPVISIECSDAASAIALAPSVITEANSAVIRNYFIVGGGGGLPDGDLGIFFASTSGAEGTFAHVGVVDSQLEAGSAGIKAYPEFDTLIPESVWQACTIAVRMQPIPPRNIPTLSEWGLITMAGILGIVGFVVMRRRKVTA